MKESRGDGEGGCAGEGNRNWVNGVCCVSQGRGHVKGKCAESEARRGSVTAVEWQVTRCGDSTGCVKAWEMCLDDDEKARALCSAFMKQKPCRFHRIFSSLADGLGTEMQ